VYLHRVRACEKLSSVSIASRVSTAGVSVGLSNASVNTSPAA
jgi:hypothetical protein